MLENGDPKILVLIRRIVTSINGSPDTDIEQDVFLKCLEAFRKAERVQHPGGLVRKIAHDAVVDAWRTRRRHLSTELVEEPNTDGTGLPMIEDFLDRRRQRALLREAILELGLEIRGAVYLFYVEQYSIRTIAEVFDKSPSAVKMALLRGRRRLCRMMQNDAPTATNKVSSTARRNPQRPAP